MSQSAARCVALVCCLVLVACTANGTGSPQLADVSVDKSATYEFMIPRGTGARIDHGESVSILPESLRVRVGQSIKITNLDDRGHLAGPFYIGAGQILTQRFTRAGRIKGSCSVHLSGTFELVVDP